MVLWNNKNVCVGGKSFYHPILNKKVIVMLEDLAGDKNNLIVKNLTYTSLSLLEVFHLMKVIEA